MASRDICPTEDALEAFLEHLVDPTLPTKPSTRDNLPPSQQQLVANQVHSVVLLYNYYLRKQYPELAFLSFVEFCKLAVILRPTLSVHMKSMQKPNETELVDLEQLSLTEDMVLNACNICKCLDASKTVPDIEGWPISKVAVLLIDRKKKNCFLLFSSITKGVWSVVEKDVDTLSQSSEVTSGVKYTYKKKRVLKKPTKNDLSYEEDGILQLGYSAVKEAAGIDKTDITVLESYTVYSHSKAKTASRFYIMKCSQLINQESIHPIKYLIESLQGPLVRRSCGSWTVTSVVDYFHVLPYSEIISDWISREAFSNSLQDSKLAEKNMIVSCSEVTESYITSEGIFIGLNIKSTSDTIGALNQNENNENCGVTCSPSIKEVQDAYVDNTSPFKIKQECQPIGNTLQVNEDQKMRNPSVQHYSNQSKSPNKADNRDLTMMVISEGGTKDQSTCDKICAKTAFENDSIEKCALIANNPNSNLEKLQILTASEGKTLSQTSKALIAYNPNSDLEKLQILTASKGKTLLQTAKACFENDSIEECAFIANNPNTDLENIQFHTALKGKTLSQTAKASFENDSLEECALIANNSNSEHKKLQIVTATNGNKLSQTAKASSKIDSIEQCALIANNPYSDLEKFQIGIASEGNTLLQTAKASSENNSVEECAFIANNPNSDLEKLQIVMASKENTLSQTALNALMQKRNQLALQQRMIEDEIALCDKKIQRMLTSIEDNLELKIESIIEGCNESWVRNEGRMLQHLEDQCLTQYIKRRRLTEAVLVMQSPCQELDKICHENGWLLPIYRVSELEGGFQANVAVKGSDFECSCGGNLCSHPREARESAAAQMLANLRSMAKSEK